jgi:hypothetical protein
MKLIKIETIKKQNIISVVEVPDIQCEEPCRNGSVSVVKYDNGKPVMHMNRFRNKKTGSLDSYEIETYETGNFFLYSDEMLEKVNKLNETYLFVQNYWEADDHWDHDSYGSNVEKQNCLTMVLASEYSRESLVLPIEKIISDVKTCMRDSDYVGFCMEEEEFKEYQSEKERKELEKAASAFSAQCGHPVGTPAYVLAIHKAINGAFDDYDEDRSGERRMERWAAHQYCGSSDSFWEDEDYINGQHMSRIDSLQMVLTWLTANCPLLMLKMDEKIKSNSELVEA